MGRLLKRVLGWSLAAKLTGAAAVLAMAAGIGVLAWGVARTSDSGGAPGDLPPFSPSNELDRDLALLRATSSIGDQILSIDGGLTTWSAAKSAAGDTGMSTHEPDAGAPTWFFRFRGILSPLAGAASGGPPPIPPKTWAAPTLSCRDVIVFFAVAPVPEGPTLSLSNGPAAGHCLAVPPISREFALIYASRTAFWRSDQPPSPAAEFTTLADASSRLAIQSDGSPATPVWLVTLTGKFFEPPSSSPAAGTPPPSPDAHCARQAVIIDANSGEVIYQTSVPSTSCS